MLNTVKSKVMLALFLLSAAAAVHAVVIQGEYPFNSGNYIVVQVDSVGRFITSPVAGTLPTGASTDTKQDTGNTSLASIDSKLPALSSGTVPVSIGGTVPVSIAGVVNTTRDVYTYRNVTTNTTTVVKSGAGTLKGIVFNTPGTLSSMAIYDNTAGSGTKIGTINTTLGQNSLNYEIQFTTGLTIVTSGTLAADATITYK